MSTDSACRIGIANLALEVVASDPQLIAAVRRRYAAFQRLDPPLLQLRITAGTPPPQPERITINRSQAQISAPTLHATLDLEAQQGDILAAPPYLADAVEQVLRVACALLACDHGGLLIHTAAIVSQGRGYLFLGPSGAGKTTVARNAAGRLVLNDDLVLLTPDESGWRIWATPFSNPTQVAPAGPASAPVAGLFHLIQAPSIALQPMSMPIATAQLSARAPLVGGDPSRAATLLRRTHAICAAAPSHWLYLLPNPEFWSIIETTPGDLY